MMRFLRPACIALPLRARRKQDAIEELIALLEAEGLLGNVEDVRKDVFVREKQMSTGLTEGLAIPHARSEGAKDVAIALGLTPDGIEFASLDMEPAHAIFLVVSPVDQTSAYLQCLAEISSFYARPDVRERLPKSKTVAEVLTIIGCP